MDALKRAEKAREAQAEKAATSGEAGGPQSRELSLDPMDDAPVDALDRAGTAGAGTEDSLELTPEEVKRQIESMENSAIEGILGGEPAGVASGGLELALEQSQAMPRVGAGASAPLDDSLSLEYGDIPLDETGSTLPSMRAAQRSVQDYFDGTHSMSMSIEDVRGTLDTAEDREGFDTQDAGPDTEGNTTSQRRAQTVLDASARPPSHTARNIGLILVLLILLGGVGGGVYMFKDKLMTMLTGRPPLVAQQRPQAAPPRARRDTGMPVPAIAATAGGESVAADEREAILKAAEQARAQEAARAQALADAEARGRAEAEVQAKAATEAAIEKVRMEVEENARAEAEAEVVRRLAAEQVAATEQLAAARADAGSAFTISKRRGPARVHRRLVSAFEAFQRGEDGVAMKIYLSVLKREPRNRDAMLGAAAVYMRAGSLERAAGYYMEVLRRNPRDGAAQAGLLAIQDNVDPVASESRVKESLARTPRDANLHFALGNLYAEQARWAEAQQSYFEAYRLDNSSPDYAFNLAVSLDRLAQSRPALEYYRRAEELATEFPAAFDTAVAQRRAAELAGS
jgi:tetratricopeptide (TPR) repeat protein